MKYKLLLGLFAVIIICSAILTFVPVDQACGAKSNSCEVVHASDYEYTFGIKNSHLGLAAFIILFGLTLSHLKNPKKIKKSLITLGLILGTLFAIYFIIIQLAILKAICSYCMIADVATIISFIIFFTIKGEVK